jgi:1-deoxy-D-xylulose-5-phosphate reductoisomerase
VGAFGDPFHHGLVLRVASSASDSRTTLRRVTVLGCTGSIGTNSLAVIAALPDRLRVFALAAHRNRALALEQAHHFRPRYLALTDPAIAATLSFSDLPTGTELLTGPDALERLATHPDTDIVLAAIVGIAGLPSTLAAVRAGKVVALANKEALVVAGALVLHAAAASGATLLPVDSEHSAIFQALAGRTTAEVARVVLTGSGGPFRGQTRAALAEVTAEQALQHPTWKMGPKISVDSATLMNKALEVIEAKWLFQLAPEQIDVIIHPESIVHSFVEFVDRSVLAQLSPPDMRLPIQLAFTWPTRCAGPARALPWDELRALHFAPPDRTTFPAVDFGREVAARGGTAGAALNAANEAAVARFLAGEFRFLDITRACRSVLDQHPFSPHPDLDELLAIDRWARLEVSRWH